MPGVGFDPLPCPKGSLFERHLWEVIGDGLIRDVRLGRDMHGQLDAQTGAAL